ncbi:MAG: methyltransferase domain-containing protein [Microscillaceae bacterium]|nr:methyltransferase domain-containing protein [Microscillaceae bacterium]
MRLLNLGCGHRFHPTWTNVDFTSTAPGVIAHNLLSGIPFDNNSYDVVYHSHVLEHFSRQDGKHFIRECHRVLKPGGILRMAIPNLEQIARLYLQKLELAAQGDPQAAFDYEWIMLEMYDQTVRTQSGGDMAQYLFQESIPNEDFVYNRIGEEGRNIRRQFLDRKQNSSPTQPLPRQSFTRHLKNFLKKILTFYCQKPTAIELAQCQIGKFRLGGEVHLWMYDRYSLKKLLLESGFKDFIIQTAFESRISSWNEYELESKDGIIFKPDSLFVEVIK